MTNFKKYILKPGVPLLDGMQALNDSGLGVLVIVDDEGCLVGTLGDGDVRRALLSGLSVSDSVSLAINKDPIVLKDFDSIGQNYDEMVRNHTYVIPVIDESKKVVDVYVLPDNVPIRKDNPVFIMAGGFGSRLYPLTETCPKPMLPINGKPMLELIINKFKVAGFYKFYISTHFLPEVIREYFGDGEHFDIEIQYTYEDSPLGTGGALSLLPKNMPKLPLIMINGDVLTNVDFNALLNFHNSSGSLATLCVREFEYEIPFGVVDQLNGRVVAMTEKPKKRYSVNAGIYVLSPEVIREIPTNKRIDMPTVFQKFLDKDMPISAFPLHEYWIDVGRPTDIEKVQN